MRKYRSWLLCCIPTILATVIVGCGGGNTAAPPPAQGRTFYSKFNSILVGSSNLIDVARGFVTLQPNANIPVAVGIEMPLNAVRELPLPPNFNQPVVYGINLPPETVYSPFTYVAVILRSGQNPPGARDIPHFQTVFGMGPPQLPSAECGSRPDPETCLDESQPAAGVEVPPGYVIGSTVPEAGGAVLPGIGIAYEDVVLPQPSTLQSWNSIGQNLIYYQGHLNALSLLSTRDYLLQQSESQAPAVPDAVKNIKQPQVYPKPGYYPQRYDIRYDASREMFIFILSDFREAQNVLTLP